MLKTNKLILIVVFFSAFSFSVLNAKDSEVSSLTISTVSLLNRTVEFAYRMPKPRAKQGGLASHEHCQVLMLVPGYNGSAKAWIEGENAWTRFADKEGLILLAPTFKTDLNEVRHHKGYYYPEQWSGNATLHALSELHVRTGADVSKILLFGFSAGAHFAHGFALWKPGRVKAFVAYSGAWWTKPTAALRHVSALIMCGEADERLTPTLEFFQQGAALHLPWIWRSYAGIGHEMRPEIIRMAEAFLDYYANSTNSAKMPSLTANNGMKPLTANNGKKPLTANGTANGTKQPSGKIRKSWVGDIQTYETFPAGSAEAKQIPLEERVVLPSAQLAAAWRRETPPVSHR